MVTAKNKKTKKWGYKFSEGVNIYREYYRKYLLSLLILCKRYYIRLGLFKKSLSRNKNQLSLYNLKVYILCFTKTSNKHKISVLYN